MIAKKDYLIAGEIGILTGIFALVSLFFINISFPYDKVAVPLGIAVLWVLGVWLGGFLGKHVAPFFTQFGKFAATGFFSASIDFAALNFISYLTGITAGVVVGWINIPGFLLAVLNGYVWNKLWVFKSQTRFRSLIDLNLVWGKGGVFSDFPKFLLVTVIGLLLNSGVIILLTTYISGLGFTAQIWLNIAKVAANALAMIWNFAGYKFIVFRK